MIKDISIFFDPMSVFIAYGEKYTEKAYEKYLSNLEQLLDVDSYSKYKDIEYYSYLNREGFNFPK